MPAVNMEDLLTARVGITSVAAGVVLVVAFMLVRSVVRDGKRAAWEIVRVVAFMIAAGLVNFSGRGRIGPWGAWVGFGGLFATLLISLVASRASSSGRLLAGGDGRDRTVTSTPSQDMAIEPLLSRYPGPLILRSGKRRLAGHVLLGAAFTVMGVYMVRSHADYGWLALLLSGLGTLVFLAAALSGASLTLDSAGFQTKNFGRLRRSNWQNVTNIRAASYPAAQRKFVHYSDSRLNNGRSANTLGYNAMLSNTFGMSGDDLASLMTKWQHQALGRRAQSANDL